MGDMSYNFKTAFCMKFFARQLSIYATVLNRNNVFEKSEIVLRWRQLIGTHWIQPLKSQLRRSHSMRSPPVFSSASIPAKLEVFSWNIDAEHWTQINDSGSRNCWEDPGSWILTFHFSLTSHQRYSLVRSPWLKKYLWKFQTLLHYTDRTCTESLFSTLS